MNDKELNWDEAKAHLDTVEGLYKDIPYQSSWFALGVIGAIRKRYNDGERTPELHKEIMEME